VAWDTSTTSATKCVPTNIQQLLKKSKLYSICINRMMQKNEGGWVATTHPLVAEGLNVCLLASKGSKFRPSSNGAEWALR